MQRIVPSPLLRSLFALLVLVPASGCVPRLRAYRTPTAAGYNTRDLIDPPAQLQFERRANYPGLLENAARIRSESKSFNAGLKRTVLCLSGGGTYGAYSAGVLCGWTETGERPTFDVVTGVSTGALIAPFAFLGPSYDAEMKRFYTTLHNRDVFRITPLRAVFGEAVTSNAPLERQLDSVLTPKMIAAIAAEHRKGRRLYVGTTELEGQRFVIWNLGAFADRGRPEDIHTMKHILMGSAAIPGFFPPAEVPVTVDGKRMIERHIDGGVSQALFFQPPHVPHEQTADREANSLAGVSIYAIVAGKIYADPSTVRPRAITIAGQSVGTVLYAQTRGDLQRMWTLAELTGMDFHMTAIPPGFPAPASATDFDPREMRKMFDEGLKQARTGTAWRTTPPGMERGETPLVRNGTDLNYETRGPKP